MAAHVCEKFQLACFAREKHVYHIRMVCGSFIYRSEFRKNEHI